ncbi:hypothetical protein ACIA47_19350 [Micromonospora sp. NPDC051227]|uniref:hypothetical protein n=1 Tax=Micromonospora sp. NPDC051227 TaxID=3364285 RepID=UPI0019327866|nr:hypothetical protein [Micromonospora sp. STR1s_5]
MSEPWVQQALTLLGTILGALLGLLAPVVTGGIGRRERDQTAQRDIARQILEIFESPQPLTDLLCSNDSAARRRLYLLAMRVQDSKARESALELVAVSGSDGSAERLHDAWFNAMTHVGRVWRQGKA